MPHFSPISWLITGLVFYLILMLFISLFWWVQNYQFPGLDLDSQSIKVSKWDWS